MHGEVAGIPVQRIRNVYSSTNVTDGAWVQLDAALDENCSAVEVFDSSGALLKLGIGPSGGEADLTYIIPGGNGYIKLRLDKGARLSVRSVDTATVSTGQLTIVLYR